jgi:predicted amidohydrolase
MTDAQPARRTTVATASMRVVHDKQANLNKYRAFINQAALSHADLLVLPEQSLQGYIWGISHSISPEEYRYHLEMAEAVPGETTAMLARASRDHGMCIVFGMTELGPYDVLYNSAVLVRPDGSIGVFRKVHAPGDELHTFRQGDQWPVFETPFGRLGALICYDAIFPESTRELTLAGAEILVMPTAWPRFTNYLDRFEDDTPMNELLGERYLACTLVRAVENQRWFVSSNQVGVDDRSGLEYAGHSRIIAPIGEVVADTGSAEGLAVAEIEVQAGIVDAHIDSFDFLKDRATHTYRRIGDPDLFRIATEYAAGRDHGGPADPADSSPRPNADVINERTTARAR